MNSQEQRIQHWLCWFSRTHNSPTPPQRHDADNWQYDWALMEWKICNTCEFSGEKMLFRNVSDALGAVRREKKNQRIDQSFLPEFIKKDVSPPSAPQTWQLLSSKPRNREYKQVYKLKANFLKINSGGFHSAQRWTARSLPSFPWFKFKSSSPFCASLFKFPSPFPWEPPGWQAWDGAGGQAQRGVWKGEGVKGQNLAREEPDANLCPPTKRG